MRRGYRLRPLAGRLDISDFRYSSADLRAGQLMRRDGGRQLLRELGQLALVLRQLHGLGARLLLVLMQLLQEALALLLHLLRVGIGGGKSSTAVEECVRSRDGETRGARRLFSFSVNSVPLIV